MRHIPWRKYDDPRNRRGLIVSSVMWRITSTDKASYVFVAMTLSFSLNYSDCSEARIFARESSLGKYWR